MTGEAVVGDMHEVPDRRDRIPRLLIKFAVGIPLALILLAASPLGRNFLYVMVGIPILMLLWVGAAVWSIVLCVSFARRRSWKSSLKLAVLPIGVIIVALNFYPFIRGCIYVGDVLHFVVARPYYDHVIASLPPTGRPRLAVFNWGGMPWASGGLVYDESDEVALPLGQQSAAWKANPGRAELDCGFVVSPLWSHYYLASFPC
jgi:hypothetical protein